MSGIWKLVTNINMSQYDNNRAYMERKKLTNFFINVPEETKRNFKIICAALDTDMSSVVRPLVDKFIKKNSKYLGNE